MTFRCLHFVFICDKNGNLAQNQSFYCKGSTKQGIKHWSGATSPEGIQGHMQKLS